MLFPIFALNRKTSAFDPATLNLSGWWRNFSGTTWTGDASAGLSGGRTLGTTATAPAVGASLNGHASAEFDGTDNLNTADAGSGGSGNGETIGDFVLGSSGAGWALVEYNSLAADPGVGLRFTAPTIIDDNGTTAYYTSAHDGGNTHGLSSLTVAYESTFLQALTTGVQYLVQWRHDGSFLYCRVNNGTWQAETAEPLDNSYLTSFFRVGSTLNAKIWELATSKDFLSDATFNNVRSYIANYYGVSV